MVFSEFFFFCCFLNTTKSFYLSDFKLRTLGFCYTGTVDSIIDDLTATVQLNGFCQRALSPTPVHTCGPPRQTQVFPSKLF